MAFVLLIIVAVALAVVAWPRPEFIVAVDDGRVALRRGKVPRGFLEECQRLCVENGIRQGRVSGSRGTAGIELRFSGNIAAADQQRFRNIWSLHG